jgi:hypothetical protein
MFWTDSRIFTYSGAFTDSGRPALLPMTHFSPRFLNVQLKLPDRVPVKFCPAAAAVNFTGHVLVT